MQVFLICDYDGPTVIDFGATAGSAESNRPSVPAFGAGSPRVARRNIRTFLRWGHGLSRLRSGIATLVTVRPGAALNIPPTRVGTSRST
jgi:hypothetical protein